MSDSQTPPETRPPRRRHAILRTLGPFLALALVILLFGVIDSFRAHGGKFISIENLQLNLKESSIVAVAALGMTLIIISGGIDLSAGTALALSATVLAYFLNESTYQYVVASPETSAWIPRLLGPDSGLLAALDGGWCVPLAIAAAIVTGAMVGLVNGLLVSLLRIVPFIVTLGTMTICLGLANYIADETTIRPSLDRVPRWLAGLISTRQDSLWLGLPMGVWMALVLAIMLAAVLRYTVFGRYVFALGSNESTARLCGVNVPVTKVVIYTLAGLFVGIAGMFQFSKLAVGNPTSGLGMELKIIAAVVIGGGSLNGGQGSVLGTLAGTVIIFVIANGCTMLSLASPSQDIILGLIIIAAVALDQLRQRRAAAA